MKEKYYFTFMQKQTGLKDKFIVFEGGYIETRKAMSRRYQDQWAFQYSEEQWILPNGKTQAEEYGLTEVKI